MIRSLLTIILLASVYAPLAQAQHAPGASAPEHFQFLQGHAYMGGESLVWENGKLISTKNVANFDGKGGVRKTVEQFEPSPQAWARFWKTLEAAGVWKWKDHYDNAVYIADGEGWSLELRHAGRSLKSQGYNAVPSEFDAFRKAVDQLIKESKKLPPSQ